MSATFDDTKLSVYAKLGLFEGNHLFLPIRDPIELYPLGCIVSTAQRLKLIEEAIEKKLESSELKAKLRLVIDSLRTNCSLEYICPNYRSPTSRHPLEISVYLNDVLANINLCDLTLTSDFLSCPDIWLQAFTDLKVIKDFHPVLDPKFEYVYTFSYRTDSGMVEETINAGYNKLATVRLLNWITRHEPFKKSVHQLARMLVNGDIAKIDCFPATRISRNFIEVTLKDGGIRQKSNGTSMLKLYDQILARCQSVTSTSSPDLDEKLVSCPVLGLDTNCPQDLSRWIDAAILVKMIDSDYFEKAFPSLDPTSRRIRILNLLIVNARDVTKDVIGKIARGEITDAKWSTLSPLTCGLTFSYGDDCHSLTFAIYGIERQPWKICESILHSIHQRSHLKNATFKALTTLNLIGVLFINFTGDTIKISCLCKGELLEYKPNIPQMASDAVIHDFYSCINREFIQMITSRLNVSELAMVDLVMAGRITDCQISTSGNHVELVFQGKKMTFSFPESGKSGHLEEIYQQMSAPTQAESDVLDLDLEDSSPDIFFVVRPDMPEGIYEIQNLFSSTCYPEKVDDFWTLRGAAKLRRVVAKPEYPHHPWVLGAVEFGRLRQTDRKYVFISDNKDASNPLVALYRWLV